MYKTIVPGAAFLFMSLTGCVGEDVTPPIQQPLTLADEICTESSYPPPFEGGLVIATEVVTPVDQTRNYEGPLWLVESQTLLFCDRPSGDAEGFNVLALTGGEVSVFAPGVSCGGLAFYPDKESVMVAVGRNSGKAQIGKLNLQTQVFETITEDASGEALTNPNDVVVGSNGIGYVSDNAANIVYKVAVDGTTTIAKSNLSKANGVSLSLDESTLYVSGKLTNTSPHTPVLYRLPILDNGDLGEPSIVQDMMPGYGGGGVADGMALDCAGNIYIPQFKTNLVYVLNPQYEVIGEIEMLDQQNAIAEADESTSNVAFGGPNRQTLYITSLTGRVYAVELNIPGLPY